MNAERSALAMVLITIGTVCALAATDLVLPAVPMLPTVVPGTAEAAQWVLAAFSLGTGAGLLIFGELGARFRIVDLLIGSLFAFAVLSVLATLAESLVQMSVLRFFQGLSASAPAVYAPVMVKSLYDETRAVAMIGRIGSIESMAPAIAPVIGAVLLGLYGWRSSFYLVAVLAAAMALGWLSAPTLRQQFGRLPQAAGGYAALLRNATFVRYALSQACNLGGLLTIVFSAPKIIASSMGGALSDFVTMQLMGITLYVIAANTTGVFARWWGDEHTILYGSVLSAVGSLGLIAVAIFAGTSIPLLWACFLLVNLGLGIRGPVGFYKALVAAGSNDARGAALMILFVMLVAAGGTAAVATVIEQGLLPLSLVASAILWGSVLLLLALPALAPRPPQQQ